MSIQAVPTTVPAAAPSAGAVGQPHDTAGKPEAPVGQVPRAEVERAVDEVRKAVAPVAQDLRFSLDEQTGKTVIRVVDAATNELIRQIPSEEVLAIARALDKLEGLLLHHEA